MNTGGLMYCSQALSNNSYQSYPIFFIDINMSLRSIRDSCFLLLFIPPQRVGWSLLCYLICDAFLILPLDSILGIIILMNLIFFCSLYVIILMFSPLFNVVFTDIFNYITIEVNWNSGQNFSLDWPSFYQCGNCHLF